MRERDCDVLIVGSGIAGLSLAIALAGRARVVVLTKKSRADSNTNYAQGGIAAVMSAGDDPALHIADTLRAGAGLCHEEAVSLLVREGPERVRELIEWGARFNRVDGELALCREGGHSRPRIVYSGDSTGREIEQALLARLARQPDVELFEDHIALELLVQPQRGPGVVRCAGAVALARETGELLAFRAGATVLASGGMGRVYRHTTNPDIATGDGVAAAYRAGAMVANPEFIQFHPTALFPAEDRAFLISEAVRGEGAVLRRPDDGRPLLEGHPDGSLATRDVVARAIDRVLHETGHHHALLDLSPIPAERIPDRFPVIFRTCLERGIDIRREPIPVVPAAHYACGGVCTDLSGRTSLEGLYAAGEVACTGVHGANRLASNSLLEALVYSHRIAGTLLERAAAAPATTIGPRPGTSACVSSVS
jgi:L-aspartate oxidase